MLVRAVIALSLLTLYVQANAKPHKAEQGTQSQQPSSPASPITPEQSDGHNLQSKPQQQSPYEVRVVSTPAKDGYDRAIVWINGLLAIVGIAGVSAAVITLRKIERQTAAMENQLAIQREMLRPRLNVSNLVNDIFSEATNGHYIVARLKISNSGGMPAYNVIPETWMEFIAEEIPTVFSSKAIYYKADPINVDTATPQGFQIPFNRRLTEAEIEQMIGCKGAICFRIRLTYFAFAEEVHSDHAFAAIPEAMESMGHYTSAT